jgi:hypothetical protein
MIMRYTTEHGSVHLIDFEEGKMQRTAGKGRGYITNDHLWQRFNEILRVPKGLEPSTWDDLPSVMSHEDIVAGDRLYYMFPDGGWQITTRIVSSEQVQG